MKRLLLILLCIAMVALPATAVYDFQNGGQLSSFECLQHWSPAYICYWSENTTGGNSYLRTTGEFTIIQNKMANPFTYAAFTVPVSSADPTILLGSSTNSTMDTLTSSGSVTAGTRFEIKVVGSTAYYYKNGILADTSSALAQTPSYLGISIESGGAGPLYIDDYILSDSDPKSVASLPKQNGYYIKRDMVNPSANGFFNSSDSLMYSLYLPISFSRSNISSSGNDAINESLYLVNYESGTTYATAYTGNVTAGYKNFDLSAFLAGNPPYGVYHIKFNNTYSDETISYIANGASIYFDADTYNQGSTATMTYLIDGAYWDTSTYAYYLKIYDGTSWEEKQSTAIAASSGTSTYSFTTDDNQGVYYAAIEAVPNAGGSAIWMNFDYATLSVYFGFSGHVNAYNGTTVSGANVFYNQGDTSVNATSGFDGNYSVNGFLTGLPIWSNTSATGYVTQNFTFTVMSGHTITRNITLNATSPSYTGLAIGGVARDGVFTSPNSITNGYGRPISSPLCYLQNTTHSESYSTTGNIAGWYLFDETTSAMLTSGRVYNLWCNKTGYSNSSVYQVVAA